MKVLTALANTYIANCGKTALLSGTASTDGLQKYADMLSAVRITD